MKVLDHGFVELVSKQGHIGPNVISSARCSTGSESDDLEFRDRKLIAFLLREGHTSPFRHSFYTFHIKAPLFTFRQMWKYQVGSTWREYDTSEGVSLSCPPLGEIQTCSPKQMGEVVASDIQIDTDQGCSWNEVSGRYRVLEPEFYMPKVARRNDGKQSSVDVDGDQMTLNMQTDLRASYEESMKRYRVMLGYGIAKELARLVLPPSIYSECYWTVSLQAVLHFLDQRLEKGAQYEIRQYASAVLELIRPSLTEMGIEKCS